MLKPQSARHEGTITITHDSEARVWIAENDMTGLVLESESHDELIRKVRDALPEMMELNHITGYSDVEHDTLPHHEVIAA